MKRILLVLLGLMPFSLYAQVAPQAINYQAVLRTQDGSVMDAKDVRLRFTILSGSVTGAEVYQEIHTLATSAQGLVNVQLGSGTPAAAAFGDIDWSSGSHYLKLEVLDVEGGSGYVDMGTQQLFSVPYSLYANRAREAEQVTGLKLDALADVSTPAPASGQVLKWDGSAWVAAADENETTPSGPAGGDLDGTYPDPVIAAGAVTIAKLNLANDAGGAAGSWKGLQLPSVDFSSSTDFADNTVWGIEGTPANGAVVYNPGMRLTNGFHGTGFYGWSAGQWIPIATGDGKGGPGKCMDPGPAIGALGCVSFTYRGAAVTYTTVRAADSNIWLQQNLGADKVAASLTDNAAYGHQFQWGRWDDGHQLRNSPMVDRGTITPNNPSGLGGGNANFIRANGGAASPVAYWWNAGTAADTWSGTTASASNGIDPCAALGAGWRMPTADEYGEVFTKEKITSGIGQAFESNLKIPAAGTRYPHNGGADGAGSSSVLWTSKRINANNATSYLLQSGQARDASSYVGMGGTVRCIKK